MTEQLELPLAETDGTAADPCLIAVRYDEPRAGRAGARGGVILYLHGLGSDQSGEKADFFRRRAVEDGFAFCSFDFRGHGASGGSLRELSLSRNLADVGCVHEELRRRGHDRVVLLGSSMGGVTGLWYAALYPEAVEAGLHIAPAVDLGPSFVEELAPAELEHWRDTGARRIETAAVTFDLGWSFVTDCESYGTGRLAELYRTPSLLLQGRLDTSVPWRSVADFVAGCAYGGIDLHLFADGDHRLNDRKERLWSLMMEFLEGRGLARPTPVSAVAPVTSVARAGAPTKRRPAAAKR